MAAQRLAALCVLRDVRLLGLQRLDCIERVPEQLEFPANLIVRGPERLRLRFTARAA